MHGNHHNTPRRHMLCAAMPMSTNMRNCIIVSMFRLVSHATSGALQGP